MRRAGPQIAVVGAGECDEETAALAHDVGRLLGEAGAVVVTGGLGGVMAAASRGASLAGATTLGICPGEGRDEANPWVRVAVPTGLGELRNGLVVRAADVVIALGGEYGTLSEVALALKIGRPVVGISTWQLVRPGGVADTGIVAAPSPEAAVAVALQLAREPRAGPGCAGAGNPPA